MKFFLIALFCLITLTTLAIIDAERCHAHDVTSCMHEVCNGDYTIACVSSVCTCIVSFCGEHQANCHTNATHCTHYANTHNCPCAHDWHCIDGHCTCGYPTNNEIQPIRK